MPLALMRGQGSTRPRGWLARCHWQQGCSLLVGAGGLVAAVVAEVVATAAARLFAAADE